MVLFAATSQDAWSVLEGSFASQSTARSMAIRQQLQDMKKRDLSVSFFFNKIKALSHTLTSIGRPLSDEEFTSFVLNGLDSEYDSLVEAVHGCDTPIAPCDLYARLLGTEHCLETRRAAEVYTDHSSANAAYRNGPRSRPPSGASGKPPFLSSPSQKSSAYSGAVGGRQGGQGNPRSGCPVCGAQGNRPPCQLCGILGHLAFRCHKRFKHDFLGIGNDGRNNERQAAMATNGQAPQGYTPSYPVDSSWYMDTGATDHLTSELGKLTSHEPYQGHDKVHTANGAGSSNTGRPT